MKRIVFKIFTMVLSFVFLSCFMFGCAKKPKDKDTIINPLLTTTDSSFEGIHKVSATKTSSKIAENGVAKYEIIIPDDYALKGNIWSAASDLRLLLNQASKANFSIVTESNLTAQNYISLGSTQKSKQAEVVADINIVGENGYKIVTKNCNVFIVGGGDLGTLNGVYDFLKQTVNYAVYAADEVYVDKGDVYFYDLDITEKPDIQYRVGDVTSRIDGDELYRKRLRYNTNSDVFMFVKGTLYHNSLSYFEEFVDDVNYADWFSIGKHQLCYTARGNDVEVDKMLDIASDLIVETAKESDSYTVTLQQSDGDTWCDCETCSAEKTKYGTDSAVMVKFMNRLSDMLAKKMESAGMGNRTINICFFAYMRTEKAPAVKSADGNYSAIDSSVVCRDNVAVYYAPIYADYGKPFNAKSNPTEYENLLAWNSICKKSYVWLYQTNFSHYLYPYNSLPTMADRYKFIASRGAEFIFDQNQWDQNAKTAFHRLKAWMGAELSWDVNADYNELLDKYFNGYFYSASKPMRELFDSITFHMEKNALKDMEGGIYFSVNQSRYFDKAVLDGWLELINKAYASIDQYKTSNVQLYNKLYNRINLESISVRYITLELYGSSRFSPEQLLNERKSFMNDCIKLGINMRAELFGISPIFSDWGLM